MSKKEENTEIKTEKITNETEKESSDTIIQDQKPIKDHKKKLTVSKDPGYMLNILADACIDVTNKNEDESVDTIEIEENTIPIPVRKITKKRKVSNSNNENNNNKSETKIEKPDIRKILGKIKEYGEKMNCSECSTVYDKNHMFHLIKNNEKKFICFNCSLNHDRKELCDWEYKNKDDENVTMCYRCGCYKSISRFDEKGKRKNNNLNKKIDKFKRSNGKFSYCTYCKLKDKLNRKNRLQKK